MEAFAEPGRGAGERRERREAPRVELAGPVEERDGRQLAEDDDDDGRRAPHAGDLDVRIGREGELRDRRREEEEAEQDERRRREQGDERPERARPQEREPGGAPREQAEDEQKHGALEPEPVEAPEGEEPGAETDDPGVQPVRGLCAHSAGGELGDEDEQGGDEDDREPEEDDVERGRAARREERRVVAERVEER